MKLIARRNEREYAVEVLRRGTGYIVTIDGREIVADFVSLGQYVRSLRMEDGTQYSLVHHAEGSRHQITVGGSAVHLELFDPLAIRRGSRDDAVAGSGVVKALMPGRVVRVSVRNGEAVRKGAGLMILEAMKMENEIQAPFDGIVQELLVTAGQTVEAGAELLRIEAS